MNRSAIGISALLALGAVWLGTSGPVRPYAATLLGFGKAPAAEIAELSLEKTIPLGGVKGRIDHMAADVARKRLFVAELGNNSVAVIDLSGGTVVKRLTGLREPQGVAYGPTVDRLFVANGGDGRVRVYKGDDLSLVGEVALGDDADNVRIDKDGRIFVGYGSGAIALIDPASLQKIGGVQLAAHPESFQIEPEAKRIFVNEPRAVRIGVIDSDSGKEIARWGMPAAVENFPLALDPRAAGSSWRTECRR